MAINKNKRVATKHIRDGIKSKYNKGSQCEICNSRSDLELHHYHTVSLLLKKYAKENGIAISTDDEVLAMRDKFYEKHWHELVEDTVTLCHDHHVELHRVYTQDPPLVSASKQRYWVTTRNAKHNGLEVDSNSTLSHFKVLNEGLLKFRVS